MFRRIHPVMIDWLVLGGALLTGLLGSVHCVAMCGGIAVGLASGAHRDAALGAALRLNLGRIAGYTLAGLLAGGLGSGILVLARLDWLQIGLRVMVGAVLVVAALRILLPQRKIASANLGSALWRHLQPWHRRLLPANTPTRQIAAGALWGWLPCGLSLTMLTAAWLSARAVEGALIMAVFGLGTAITMLPLTWSGQKIGFWLQRPHWRKSGGWVLLACGGLTLAAPLLARHPTAHAVLSALGCQALG